MTRRQRTAIALSACLGILAACSINQPASGYYAIFVHGRVATVAGSSVAGVQIRLGWQPMYSCTTTFPTTDSTPSTDASGRYGILVLDSNSTHVVCIKVIATPPAAAPLAAESVVVPNVSLTTNFWSDSVRIDIVLPPK